MKASSVLIILIFTVMFAAVAWISSSIYDEELDRKKKKVDDDEDDDEDIDEVVTDSKNFAKYYLAAIVFSLACVAAVFLFTSMTSTSSFGGLCSGWALTSPHLRILKSVASKYFPLHLIAVAVFFWAFSSMSLYVMNFAMPLLFVYLGVAFWHGTSLCVSPIEAALGTASSAMNAASSAMNAASTAAMNTATAAMNAPFAEESQWLHSETGERIAPASASNTLDPLGRRRESARPYRPQPATTTFNDDGVYNTPSWMQWLLDKAESSDALATRRRGSSVFDFDRDDADFFDAVSE